MPSTRKASSSAQPSSSSTSIKRSTRSTRSAPKRSPSPATLEAQLHLAGSKLFLAASKSPLEALKALLNSGNCPIWYQDPETGWSALHFAAERGDPDLVRLLLQNGAVWNAIDNLGYTAGDISLSVNDQESYLLIRDEGLRTEMIIHALQPASSSGDEPADDIDDMDQDVSVDSEKVTDTATLTENGMTLRNEDKSSAGDNMVFLQSKLVWEKGDDGVDRVLDGDGNGVMMGWETPLMRAHVDAMCKQHPQSGKGLSILNVGFGLGIVRRPPLRLTLYDWTDNAMSPQIDTMFQEISPPPTHHAIIEAHPSVLSHIRSTGFDKRENVTMLEGRWQDWLSPKLPEKFAKLLESTPDGAGFDLIFVDTFAEGYSGECGRPFIAHSTGHPIESDMLSILQISKHSSSSFPTYSKDQTQSFLFGMA